MKLFPHHRLDFLAPVALIAAAALFFQGAPALGQAKDPLLGNWALDRGKSSFTPDTSLLSRSLSFEPKDGGISFNQKTVGGNGNTVEINYAAKYDSKEVAIEGSQLDTVALKRVDATTVERIGKIKGQVAENVTMKLSNGGKTLTITTKGSIDGTDYNSTQVYEKQ